MGDSVATGPDWLALRVQLETMQRQSRLGRTDAMSLTMESPRNRRVSYVRLTPSFLKPVMIEKFAERVGAKLLSPVEPRNVCLAVNKAGGKVAFKRHWDQRRGDDAIILISNRASFGVFVPASTPDDQNNILIAEALGYYFLHYRLANIRHTRGRIYGASLYETGPLKDEARRFATTLLMPRSVFTQQFLEFSGDSVDVARKLGLAPSLVHQRAEELGLFDEDYEKAQTEAKKYRTA